MTQLTIRDVPAPVKDALAAAARENGQSLQAYLLSVLRRQADFFANADLLVQVEGDLHESAGVGDDAPPAAKMLARARERRDDRATR